MILKEEEWFSIEKLNSNDVTIIIVHSSYHPGKQVENLFFFLFSDMKLHFFLQENTFKGEKSSIEENLLIDRMQHELFFPIRLTNFDVN